jgi:hypothetical protein
MSHRLSELKENLSFIKLHIFEFELYGQLNQAEW